MGTNPAKECLSWVPHLRYPFLVIIATPPPPPTTTYDVDDDDDNDNVWKQNSTFPTETSPFFLLLKRDGTYCCSVVCYLDGLSGVLFIAAVLQVNATNTTSVPVSLGQQPAPVQMC